MKIMVRMEGIQGLKRGKSMEEEESKVRPWEEDEEEMICFNKIFSSYVYIYP